MVSSGLGEFGVGAVSPGDGFAVDGVVGKAAVEDADETVAQSAEGGVVGVAGADPDEFAACSVTASRLLSRESGTPSCHRGLHSCDGAPGGPRAAQRRLTTAVGVSTMSHGVARQYMGDVVDC